MSTRTSPLAVTATVAVGFAFDIVRDPARTSGFAPAKDHLGSDSPLYAQPRLEGYAAMLRLRFCEQMLIPGKDERRYKDEQIWQGYAIKEILEHDLGCDVSTVRWIPSTGSTLEAARAIKRFIRKEKIAQGEGKLEFMTSHYHSQRAARIALRQTNLYPRITSAEAFTLAEAILGDRLEAAIERLRGFGGHYTDPRVIDEIKGEALFLLGRYQIQTKDW